MSGKTYTPLGPNVLVAKFDHGAITDRPTSASPRIIKADDGNRYVVKFPPAGDTKSAFNEHFISGLARHLSLPVLDSSAMLLKDEFIRAAPDLLRDSVRPGLYFATLYKDHARTISAIQKDLAEPDITNMQDVPKFVVFDVFVGNTDRNGDNCLVVPDDVHAGKYSYVLIDHASCLGGPRWQISDISHLPYQLAQVPWNSGRITDAKPFLQPLRQAVSASREDLDAIASDVPSPWSLDAGCQLALVDALSRRQDSEIAGEIRRKKFLFQEWK